MFVFIDERNGTCFDISLVAMLLAAPTFAQTTTDCIRNGNYTNCTSSGAPQGIQDYLGAMGLRQNPTNPADAMAAGFRAAQEAQLRGQQIEMQRQQLEIQRLQLEAAQQAALEASLTTFSGTAPPK